MAETIKVFIGCAPNNLDLESKQVLEYTIRSKTTQDVAITWMEQNSDPESPFSGWETSAWATPFSGFRWAIPELCNFEGKAIYMDSDMIVMDDLAKLWEQDHNGAVLMAKGQGQWRICVSMWNCEAAKGLLPSIAEMKKASSSHSRCQSLLNGHIVPFSGEWNCLDREIGEREVSDPDIKIIHYTDMSAQPQLRHAIPRLELEGRKHWYKRQVNLYKFPKINALFDELLGKAIQAGYTAEYYS